MQAGLGPPLESTGLKRRPVFVCSGGSSSLCRHHICPTAQGDHPVTELNRETGAGQASLPHGRCTSKTDTPTKEGCVPGAPRPQRSAGLDATLHSDWGCSQWVGDWAQKRKGEADGSVQVEPLDFIFLQDPFCSSSSDKGQSCLGSVWPKREWKSELARSVRIASPQPCPNRPLWAAVPSTPGSIPLPTPPLAHSILFLVPTEACVPHSVREYNRCSDY